VAGLMVLGIALAPLFAAALCSHKMELPVDWQLDRRGISMAFSEGFPRRIADVARVSRGARWGDPG